MKMKKIASLILAGCMVLAASAPAFAATHTEKSEENVLARERYIAALAIEKKISYQEAEILDQENALIPRSPDEVIRYKTLDEVAYRISDNAGYGREVVITAQIKYLYSKSEKKAVSIEGISAGYVHIPGRASLQISHGDLSYEYTSTRASITVIGALQYEDPGVSVSIGGSILSFNSTTYVVTTKTLTMKATYTLLDL